MFFQVNTFKDSPSTHQSLLIAVKETSEAVAFVTLQCCFSKKKN